MDQNQPLLVIRPSRIAVREMFLVRENGWRRNILCVSLVMLMVAEIILALPVQFAKRGIYAFTAGILTDSIKLNALYGFNELPLSGKPFLAATAVLLLIVKGLLAVCTHDLTEIASIPIILDLFYYVGCYVARVKQEISRLTVAVNSLREELDELKRRFVQLIVIKHRFDQLIELIELMELKDFVEGNIKQLIDDIKKMRTCIVDSNVKKLEKLAEVGSKSLGDGEEGAEGGRKSLGDEEKAVAEDTTMMVEDVRDMMESRLEKLNRLEEHLNVLHNTYALRNWIRHYHWRHG